MPVALAMKTAPLLKTRFGLAGCRGFTKHTGPISLCYGIGDPDTPRLANEIEGRPRSEAQKHENARRDKG